MPDFKYGTTPTSLLMHLEGQAVVVSTLAGAYVGELIGYDDTGVTVAAHYGRGAEHFQQDTAIFWNMVLAARLATEAELAQVECSDE